MRKITVYLFLLAAGCSDPGDAVIPQAEPDTVTAAPAGFFTSLAAGYYHGCGQTPAGVVYCWGHGRGMFGGTDPATDSAYRPVRLAGASPIDTLSSGANASCALANGLVLCWGLNDFGQLGTADPAAQCGTVPCSRTPVVVDADVSNFTFISAGGAHTCAATEDGLAYCWGYPAYGRLGVFQTQNQLTPRRIETSLRFRSVFAGGTQSCGIAGNAVAYCWGFGESGQLGNGFVTTSQATPTAVVGGYTFSTLALGGVHTCGLSLDGAVYCWGANPDGRLGNGSITNALAPVRAGTLAYLSLSAGGEHTCAIATDNRAYCWGSNEEGQLGDGTRTSRNTPTLVAGDLRFKQITAGYHFTCGLTTTNVAYCWGLNYQGGLGIGSHEITVTSPRRVAVPLIL
jgi:alpha-tubulin suppressor-like RCC1 family protein